MVDQYSIDEAFMDLRGIDIADYDAFAKEVSARCWRNVAIPVSVGVSHTKTLAKIASSLCKKYPKLRGGCFMAREQDIEKVLRRYPVGDVWGIGRRSVAKLTDMEQDYGLVPMCKWNAEQEDYISPISTSVGMWHIMTNTSKAALVGKTMEALSFYGYRDVTPEYYEVALGLTYARDENVLEMLSLMREKATLSLDMAYGSAFSPAITNILQMSEGFRNPPSGKENSRHGSNVSTFWATNQSSWNSNVRELFEKLS